MLGLWRRCGHNDYGDFVVHHQDSLRVEATDKRYVAAEIVSRKLRDQFLVIFSQYKRTFSCPLCASRTIRLTYAVIPPVLPWRDLSFRFRVSMCCAKCCVGFKDRVFDMIAADTLYFDVLTSFKESVQLRHYFDTLRERPCACCSGGLVVAVKCTTTALLDTVFDVCISCKGCGATGNYTSVNYPRVPDAVRAYEHFGQWQQRVMDSLRAERPDNVRFMQWQQYVQRMVRAIMV